MNKIRLSIVYKNISFILFMLSLVTFIPPLIFSFFLEDKEVLAYITPLFLSLILFSLSVPIKNEKLSEKEAVFIAVSIWFSFPLLASLTYIISEYIINPIDAYFESVSGFTTTGASILTDIEKLPKSLLLFRDLTNWIGGLGFVVFAISMLSTKLPIGRAIVKFESSKVIEEKLEPKVKEVAKIIVSVYVTISLLEFFMLKIAGLSLYDAINYTFSSVATGGFAPYNASAGVFNNPTAEFIIAIFMILGAINLQFYYLIYKKRSLKPIFQDEEVRVFLFLIIASTIFSTLILYFNHYYTSIFESFRYSFFQIVSASTTTGFSTTDYSNWHPSVLALIMILALLGAVGGSTGGGLKIYRLIFIFKTIIGEIKKIAHPNMIYKLTIKGKPVEQSKINQFWAFISLYGLTVLSFGFILTVSGHDLVTSFSASIACITSLGPGLGDVGPASNFAHFLWYEKLLLSFEMILGRLEIIPIISFLFIRNL